MESEAAHAAQDSLPFLPAELINLILLGLPVKSLLKFRSVSKSWLSLISSLQFINTHLRISANDKDHTHHRLIMRLRSPTYDLKGCSLSYLLNDSVTEAFDLGLHRKTPLESIRILGSVNGLICLGIKDQGLFIWNLSLRKFKKFHDSSEKLGQPSYYFMYGFGYDEFHNDYNVLIGYRYMSCHVKVNIYSLNSDSWTSVDDFPCGVLWIKSGVSVNGKLHWAGHNSEDYGWGIIYVDLTDGKWVTLEQPCYGLGCFAPKLGILGSDLCVVCYYERAHTDVWVMKEYGVKESWTKMFTIKFPDDPVGYEIGQLVCMSNKDEILFEFGSFFFIYSPKDDSIRYAEVTGCDAFDAPNIYIESLVWPFLVEGNKDATTSNTEKAQMKLSCNK